MSGGSPPVVRAVNPAQLRVLHVEVGGNFGGSLRALETYLAHASSRFAHDLLLYYPTPGTERLETVVGELLTVNRRGPRAPRARSRVGEGDRASSLSELWHLPPHLRTAKA